MEEKNFEPEAGIKEFCDKNKAWISELVNQPLSGNKKDDVPNVPPNDLAFLASHSCTDGNSIEQMQHEGERIVYIEYQDGIPHEVLTASENGYLSWFDFNYFYGDKKDIRWYESGGGCHKTEIQAPHYIKGTKGVVYWMAKDARFKGKPRNCKRIDSPLLIDGYLIASIQLSPKKSNKLGDNSNSDAGKQKHRLKISSR